MKLRGEFIVRKVMDDTVAIPVGQTALRFNGMVMLNDVSGLIWKCLEQDTELEQIVTAMTEAFEVSADQARTDILEFLEQLRNAQLLDA